MKWIPYAASGIAVLVTLGAAGLGTRPTTDWYVGLDKPTWQPDPSLIGLAWTVIYPLIAIVGGFVWANTDGGQRSLWVGVLAANLVLNAAWSWVFFVAQAPGWASVEILLLLISSLVLAALAWRVAPWAGLALLVYAAWVGFAGWLTLSIARMNA